jgi:hypothetical protein
MINTQAYFTNIRETILQEISLSEKSILVAVAWFTDRKLFQGLIDALKRGVKVEVCIVNDDINIGDWALPWDEFKSEGGKLYPKSEALMHHKFCVFDGKELISGSYNWTNKAALSNDEDIVLTTGDYALASEFVNRFMRLTAQEQQTVLTADIGKIVKRLQLLLSLIDLEEKSDIAKHSTRLKTETDDAVINSISEHLLQGRYQEGVEAINTFIKNHSQVTTYIDPVIKALRMEIRILEYEIVALENERTDCEKVLRHFNMMMQKEIGNLLKKILRLKRDRAYKTRHESQYSESEYQEAKRIYEEQARHKEEAEKEEELIFTISENVKLDLKKLYKQCVVLCHPDKVADKDKDDAAAIFIKLREAYVRQDIITVASIYEQLRRGWFTVDTEIVDDKGLLQKKKQEIIKKRGSILLDIEAIKASEGWQISQFEGCLEDYFCKIKLELEEELVKLGNLDSAYN